MIVRLSRRSLFLVLGVLIGAVLVMASFLAGGPEAHLVSEKTERADAHSPSVSGGSTPKQPVNADTTLASNRAGTSVEDNPAPVPSLPMDAPKEQLFEAILDASTSYDPKELPRIQPFLLHPDAEVRQAAIDGIVNLGDAAGAPLLRSAAKQALSSREAITMLEMAEFLELPSVNLTKIRKKGGNTKTQAQKRLPMEAFKGKRRNSPPSAPR